MRIEEYEGRENSYIFASGRPNFVSESLLEVSDRPSAVPERLSEAYSSVSVASSASLSPLR